MLILGTSVSTKDARSFVLPSTLLGWSWLGQTCCILDLIWTFEHDIDFILSQFSLLLVWPFTLPCDSVSPFSGNLPLASFYVACSPDGQALPHLDILVLAIQDVVRMGTAEKLTPCQTCRSPSDCARLAFILYSCCLYSLFPLPLCLGCLLTPTPQPPPLLISLWSPLLPQVTYK